MLSFALNLPCSLFNAHFAGAVRTQGITVIFGPTGSGKSTLMRALAGLEKEAKGSVCYAQDVWQDAHHWVAPEARGIGYVAQQTVLFEHLSVAQNIDYAHARAFTDIAGLYPQQLIARFKIEHLLASSPAQLSGGERQQVALVRALARAPQLLLLDEPFVGLDDARVGELCEQLNQLVSEFALGVVLVTHSVRELSLLANDVITIAAGHLTGKGAVNDMLTRLDGVLAHRGDARAVVDAQVIAHDKLYNLTQLQNAAGVFSVLQQTAKIGQTVRIAISARDVSISLDGAVESSILNRFKGQVIDWQDSGAGQVLVLLDAQGYRFLSRITRKSFVDLGLKRDQWVTLQAKSIAL